MIQIRAPKRLVSDRSINSHPRKICQITFSFIGTMKYVEVINWLIHVYFDPLYYGTWIEHHCLDQMKSWLIEYGSSYATKLFALVIHFVVVTGTPVLSGGHMLYRSEI